MKIMEEVEKFIREAKSDGKKPVVVVLGPTASGKTSLALKIAHQVQGEIISTDSRQIYRQMEIGTDAISESEQEGIPHHLMGIANPDEVVTLADYYDQALQKIDEIVEKNSVPMLVGGTGLYISAIVDGYDIPRIAPNHTMREYLQKYAEKNGNEALHHKLQEKAPDVAENIHPNNLPYVIRALERLQSTSSDSATKARAAQNDLSFFMIGINWPRPALYERVNMRVDRQIARGLVQEVQQLLGRGYSRDLPSMSSLGVKEILPYIDGESDLESCLETLKKNTRHYAKRQMTWFRRYDNIHWLTPKELKEITQ